MHLHQAQEPRTPKLDVGSQTFRDPEISENLRDQRSLYKPSKIRHCAMHPMPVIDLIYLKGRKGGGKGLKEGRKGRARDKQEEGQ